MNRTTIRTWDSAREYDVERDELLAAVDRVFRSGQLILGESVRSFEREFASYCGTEHGIGVGNATDGLFLALKALDIGAGDEVITVANTAVPTVSAIVATGATPVFVDVDATSFLMDVTRLPEAVTSRTRAIVPVHLFGQCADMDSVLRVAQAHELVVIEDCSQAHGARQSGRLAGSMGRCGVFSFYPTKVLGAYGDGGLIVTDDAELAARLRRLRYYGMERTYYAEEHGYNSRLDEVHAEILRCKLARLDEYIAGRRAVALRYHELSTVAGMVLPAVVPGNEHVYCHYAPRFRSRDLLLERLREEGIELGVHYPTPIHFMPAYGSLGYGRGSLPVTEMLAGEVFSLPMYPALGRDVQDRVISAITRLADA